MLDHVKNPESCTVMAKYSSAWFIIWSLPVFFVLFFVSFFFFFNFICKFFCPFYLNFSVSQASLIVTMDTSFVLSEAHRIMLCVGPKLWTQACVSESWPLLYYLHDLDMQFYCCKPPGFLS